MPPSITANLNDRQEGRDPTMRKDRNIVLLEARLNHLEGSKKDNRNICRKLRLEIARLKAEANWEEPPCQSQDESE